MKAIEFTFVAHPEKGEVSAILMLPTAARALVVLGHGAGAGMRHSNMQNIAEALGRQKIATMRYQFPFMERGGGRDSQAVSLSTVRQAVAAAHDKVTDLPIFAGGHSYGGRITSLAAAAAPLPEIRGLIFCSYPLHAPGNPGDKRATHLPDITVPMLFLSGTRDKMMTFDLIQPALDKLGRRATLHKLDTGDHGYKTLKRRESDEDIFDEMARVTSAWISTIV